MYRNNTKDQRFPGKHHILNDMPASCWVPGCQHYSSRETCRFFRFPTNEKLLRKWLQPIRRVGEPALGARICSCHFRDGKKENGPELFEWNEKTYFGVHHLTPEKRKGRKLFKTSENPFDDPVPSTSGYVPEPQEVEEEPQPEVEQPPPPSSSQQMLEAEVYLLRLEIEKKNEIIKALRPRMSYEEISKKDSLILEYTGLPTRDIFESLLTLINVEHSYYLKWKVQRLSKADQLLMTLMKLRQNFPHADLAFRFGVSQATVTNVVITYIHILYEILHEKLMRKIPSRNKNKSCLPNCASMFTNCRIILDCTEIFSCVPRKSMKNQRLTYSSYKHRNTLKGLVGVAPNGVVTYLSNLYPGSTSDKAIVAHCGVLNQMEVGDLILADKGFLIKDLLPPGVSLNIPPFLSTPQFTPEEVRRTECIARARIHVERAINRMKCYRILSFIPHTLFSFSSIIFKTVGALTNLQYPLIKEVSQYYTDTSVDVAESE